MYTDSIGPREFSTHVGIGEDSFSSLSCSPRKAAIWICIFRECKDITLDEYAYHTFVRKIFSHVEPKPLDLSSQSQGVRPSSSF